MTVSTLDWNKLIDLLQNTASREELMELLTFLFTHEEKQHIITRIQLVAELLSGEKTQRQIAKELDISIAKITRGSNNLKTISEPLRQYLKSELND